VPQLPRTLDPRRFERHQNTNSAWWHWTVNVLAASPAVSRNRRRALMERAGFEIGTGIVESGCFFFGTRVRFGPYSIINDHCYLDTRDEIFLDEGAGFSPGVMVFTSTHDLNLEPFAKQRRGAYRTAPVYIGPGVWVGARATILPGVSIGAGTLVAAGSIVTKDLEPHSLYAGVPARKVRDFSAADAAH